MTKLVNRAKVKTSTIGTSTITLGSAIPGYQSFASAGVLNSDVVRYAIEQDAEWEIGTGTYSSAGSTLTRNVTESSNAGALINLAGNADVYVTAAADDLLQPNDIGITVQGYTAALQGTTASYTTALNSKLSGIEAGATADQTAAEILTAIKTVDGTGTGLDADLLDGQHGTYYTGYTDTAIANLVATAPATLDTLNELATALGNDPNFATTVTTSIGTKAPINNATFTGTTVVPTADINGGTIDGTVIGGSTPASGTFTSADINGAATITDTGNVVGSNAPLLIKSNNGVATTSYGWDNLTSNYDYAIKTSGSERLRITSTGSVGIGTSSPIGKLDVSDGTNPLSIDSSTYNEIQSYNRPLLLNRQGNNVGIGTSSPTSFTPSTLVVEAPTTAGITISDSTGGGTASIAFSATGAFQNKAKINCTMSSQSLEFSTAGSERLRITSTGSVGIGTSSPSNQLSVGNNNLSVVSLDWTGDNASKASISANHATGEVKLNAVANYFPTFYSNGSERLRIDLSGNLTVNSNGSVAALDGISGIQVGNSAATSAGLALETSNRGYLWYIGSGTSNLNLWDSTANSNRLTIDSSGNVLVGRTSSSGVDTDGHVLFGGGVSYQSTNGNSAQFINRNGTDGAITTFQKNGTAVGSIGTVNGRPYIGLSDAALWFDNSNNRVVPYDTGTLAATDGTLDIGSGTQRFKDLYLAGTVTATSFSGPLTGAVTGNATTATTLQTARTIALSGDATGSVSFDGSANATINAQLAANVVGANELNVVGNGTTAQYLRSDGDGTFTWATPTDTNTTYSVGNGGLTEINFTTALNSKLAGIEAGATADQTAAEILTAIKTVDGAASGLDADLLDGLNSASFMRSDADDNFSGNLTSGNSNWIKFYNPQETDSNDGKIGAGLFATGLNIVGSQTLAGAGRQIRLWGSVITDSGYTFWHSGNDGSGSGLDADLLDGQQGSYYQPASTAITTANIGTQSVTFATDASYASYAETAGRAYPKLVGGGNLNFNWSGQSGQPVWLWGGSDGSNMYVYNPSNFSVAYAASAGNAAINGVFYENNQTVTANYTITNGKNAMSAGPITINSGITVTVGAGETWTVV